MSAPALARLPADQEARRRALDPEASFIVQAPAGSGKTSLLVQRFLVLLGGVAQPEAIAAVTFTRKAAAEMRARILAALERAGAGESGDSAHDRVTLDAARQALERDGELAWDLRANPARLRIQTIDSLCASIVQRMPWMARTGGMPRIVEDAAELYREAARRTLSRVAEPGRAGEAAERLLLHLDNDFRSLQDMLEKLLPKRDQWLRLLGVNAGGERLRAVLEASLAETVAQGIAAAARRIPPLELARLVELYNFAGTNLEPVRAPMPAAPSDIEAWRALADFLLTGGDWRKSVTVRQGFPPHCKERKLQLQEVLARFSSDDALRAALKEVNKLPDPRFGDEQWRILEALLTLLPVAAAELKVAFREHGAVDFVELGEAARAALGPPEHPTDLAFSLGDRIQHLLIDEFQDTSASQYELTERLVASWEPGAERSLFLVGDPMQSIYRFREADVGLFLRARVEGVREVACEPLLLTANFRSRPGIVDWVNAAFETIFPAAEDAALGAVRYSASTASRVPMAETAVSVHPFYAADEHAEAEEVASLAATALPGSTAILVRARSHAVAIVAALARRGVPYRAVEFDELAQRPAVLDLLALTRALLHPGDRTSWLAVLRAAWCGLTLAELHSLAAEDLKAPVWDRLATQDSPRVQRVRAALGSALGRIRRAPLREVVESAWQALGGAPDADADCLRYLDLLDEAGEDGEASFGLLERRMKMLFGLPRTIEGPAVELMTIHKAKGLEWDTVILPGLGRDAASDGTPLLRWSELPAGIVFAPIEAARGESDPIFSYLAHVERRRAHHESARLLYVAATRARERLHLLGHADADKDGKPKPRANTLLHLLWPAVREHFTEIAAPRGAPLAPPPLPQTLRRLPEDWQPPAPAPPPAWVAQEPEETAVTFEWAGDTLRHAGTVTHRWFERIARDGVDAWTVERLRTQTASIRAALAALGLADAENEHATGIVEKAVSRTLADPRGRWLLAPHAEAASELRVSVVESGAIHHCSIDRAFVDEAGVQWVVDFKTGAHEGAGLDAFLDNERARYGPRMERYAHYFRSTGGSPIRLGLYFPLMGGWREWQPE